MYTLHYQVNGHSFTGTWQSYEKALRYGQQSNISAFRLYRTGFDLPLVTYRW